MDTQSIIMVSTFIASALGWAFWMIVKKIDCISKTVVKMETLLERHLEG